MNELPRCVPDELWNPLERRVRLATMLMQKAPWLCVAAGMLSLVDLLFRPLRDLDWQARIILPLWVLSLVTTFGAYLVGRVTLHRMRRLLIQYTGRDPGGP